MFFAIYAIIALTIWLIKLVIQFWIAAIWLVAVLLTGLIMLLTGGKANLRCPRFPWWVL